MKIFLSFICFYFLIEVVHLIELASENTDFVVDESKIFKRKIKFTNSHPEKKEQNRCTFTKISKKEREYIIRIDPHGDKHADHHLTLFACGSIPSDAEFQEDGNTWDCHKYPVCADGVYRRFYTWSLNAKGIELPKGVGYRVGGDTGFHYLIVQVHYNDIDKNERDNFSGYELTMTTQDLPYQVGVFNTGGKGNIPPQREKFIIETGCKLHLPYDVVPIFYRTHAHNIIRVISTYLIKNDDPEQKWTELGRMSPRQPEMFYEVTNKDLVASRGDIITSRCTCNSMTRHKVTYQGSSHQDEMCVLYVMYYTDYKKNIYDDVFCYKDGINFDWEGIYNIYSKPPKNADSLDGVELLEPENELISDEFHS